MSWLYSLVFAGLLFSSGTNTTPTNKMSGEDIVTVTPSQGDETERIEKTFPLNANGRVCVSNVNGSITLTAWDRNEVALIAVKTADTKEHLADVDIKIDSRPDYLSIESDYGDWKNKNGTSGWKNNGRLNVDYDLKIPRAAMLNEIETVNGSITLSKFTNFSKVSAVNGTVRATNLRGTANLSTVNGEVIADMDQLETGSKIVLETVNGSAGLVIPSDSNATIKAESLNGSITNDFGLPVRKGKYVGRDLYGKLGSGEVSIKLDSVNGPLSVKRRNDGRPLSPATNLLTPKADDDEDWDGDNQKENNSVAPDVKHINREVARATSDAQKRAAQETRREIEKIKPEVARITDEAAKEAEKLIDSDELQEEIRNSVEQSQGALKLLRDAMFMPGVPRVETKSDSIAVKGTPKITVDARECSVRVHGWDKQEVRYSVAQFQRGRATPVQVSENHSDSAVNIKIFNNDKPGQTGLFENDSLNTRIEIFVPRKSNIKIVSNGEIRLEGVSGDLEVTGSDEPVNIRDSQGKLNVTSCDGRIRVIGFDGEVIAKTTDGDVYLEGNFAKLSGRASSGTFTLTLPQDANIDLSANTEDVDADGFDLAKRGANSWRLGKGGPKYDFNLTDGSLTVRNSNVLSRN